MRKLGLTILVFMLSISLLGCLPKNYDDLYNDYQTYLFDQQDTYNDLMNQIDDISEQILPSVVMIKAEFFSMSMKNVGTGVVIDQDEDYYYILTNNHVAVLEDREADNYTVSDYKNQGVHAEFMFADASYDLALLKVSKTYPLNVVDFNLEPLEATDELIVAGYPDGQINAITMGFFLEYEHVVVSDETSSINLLIFDSLISSVPVKSGSSGSAIVNKDLDLVGIVFAGRFTNAGDASTLTYAVPSDKIIEFLELRGYRGLSS